MAHGWSPDLHEVVIGVVVTVASGVFLWLLRRVRTNDLHAIEKQIEATCKKVEELKDLNREDHQKFFDRIGALETDVAVLKAKK